uniref:Uncharacterized protein n=1 Tax=Anopheles atroparvus TaxID=41427 RepID=A0A182IM98_ANOAO
MATRLATQRNFITVIPASTGSTSVPVTMEASGETAVARIATAEPEDSLSVPSPGHGTSQSETEVATVSIASTTPAMASRASNVSQLSTITVAGSLKNGSAKASLVPTTLLANGSNIMSFLSGANGLSLQQFIQQKKIVINSNGTLLDIVPITDESEGSELKIENEKLLVDRSAANESRESGSSSEGTADEAPQVTAQVAVVQAPSPTGGAPQYITVTVLV